MNFTEEKVFEQMGRLYMTNISFNELLTKMTKEKEVEKVKTKELEDEIEKLKGE